MEIEAIGGLYDFKYKQGNEGWITLKKDVDGKYLSTQAAGGCFLVAAWTQAGGHETLIVAATLGQPGTSGTILPNALLAGRDLVLSLDRALAPDTRNTFPPDTRNTSGRRAMNPPRG